MKNKKLLVDIIAIAILTILGIILIKTQIFHRPILLPGENRSLKAPRNSNSVGSWIDLDKVKTPPVFEINGYQFIGGEKDCCVCSGLASAYKFNGGAGKIFDALAPMALNHDLSFLTKALREYELTGKLYLGYYPSIGNNQESQGQFAKNIANPQTQIKLFKNGQEALETLKKLISSNIPVMFAWEDEMGEVKDPQGECDDDTYNVAVGYDQNSITYYTLPNLKTKVSISEFMQKWNLQNQKACYWIFPGSYVMMWLAK